MAYREKVFNANVLTDLLSTYLTHKSSEREKYYKAEQQANKPQIRQGADGYLYYVNQNRLGERVLPDVQKPPKTSGQGLTTEEFYFKGGPTENPNIRYMMTTTENNPIKKYDPNSGEMVDVEGGVRPKYPTGEFKTRLEKSTKDPKTGMTIDHSFRYFDTKEEEDRHKKEFGTLYNEPIPGGKNGESLLLQKKGGQYFHADTGKPVDPSLFANLTKKAPSTNNLKGPKNLKTAFYPDGSNREFDQRIFTDKDGNKI